MLIGVQADLAHQESAKKSERIGAAWNAKKVRAAKGELYTARVPLWLQIKDAKIVTVPNQVAVVREVFRLAALGVGIDNITRKLGDDIVRLDGEEKKSSRSWVAKLLSNRAVLGEFQAKGAEVIQNYFPQIISQSEFDAARSTMQAKRRNGTYVGGNRRNSHKAENLFSGLIFENRSTEEDGEAVERPLHFQRVARGSYLMSAFDKNRKANRMRYDVLERAILKHFTQEDWSAVVGEGECPEVKKAQSELNAVLREMDDASQRIARTNAAMDADDIDAATLRVLAGRVAKDEGAIMTLAERKDALEVKVDAERAKCQALHRPADLMALINSPGSDDLRLRLRSEIAKRVGRITVTFPGCTGRIAAAVWYINGVQRITMLDMR
jgi:hypothetical protein